MSSYPISSILEPMLDVELPRVAARLRTVPVARFTAGGEIDARTDAIAVACHELRNSLAVVRNAARLLRMRAPGEAVDSACALIERHVGQMSGHIVDLLEPASPGRRGRALQLSRIDLRAVARDAVDAIGPELARRGHRLALRLPAVPIWVQADGSRMEQVFSNLLINAAKYTPDGGDIALTMGHDRNHVRVSVRDSGIGIQAAMLSQVFGMFVQANITSPWEEGGSGVGLAVVRNLVELHDGTVKASSPGLGLGSEFTVILPTVSWQLKLAQPAPGVIPE
jgi:signal transduction histidine kinase